MRTCDNVPIQPMIVTIDLIDEPGIDTLAAGVFVDVLTHLEHDGVRPYRSTLEITTPATR
jgi:hypothetical protein